MVWFLYSSYSLDFQTWPSVTIMQLHRLYFNHSSTSHWGGGGCMVLVLIHLLWIVTQLTLYNLRTVHYVRCTQIVLLYSRALHVFVH
jgi:hypothetical protein